MIRKKFREHYKTVSFTAFGRLPDGWPAPCPETGHAGPAPIGSRFSMISAGSIWESESFLPAVALVVGTITAAISTWASLHAAHPRLRLVYGMPSATALMSVLPAAVPTLAVSWGTQVLAHPHVVQVRVANTGRRDILRSAFDGDRPIAIDVGEPILAVLATSGPCISSIVGSELLIAPQLLKKDEVLTFSLLVEGSAPRLVACRAQLDDVEVHDEADDARRSAVRLAVVTRVGIAIATFGLVLWIAALR